MNAVKPACMSDEEWATWNRPFLIYHENEGSIEDRETRRYKNLVGVNLMRPPSGYPCFDCPVEFAAAQKAQGTCDGEPNERGRRRLTYPSDLARERRRAQWREYGRRRRGAA